MSSMPEPAEAVSQPEQTEQSLTSAQPEVASGGAWAEVNAEPDTENFAGADPESWPEAAPDWNEAKSEWDEAWPVHVYFFASAYLVVSVVAGYFVLISLAQRGGSRTSMNKTTIGLNAMIITFAATRALVLFIDPYFSDGVFPFVVARLLWSLGIPGFTASFSIMLLILLDTTKLSLAPPRFQKVGTIGVIWLVHVVVVATTDLLMMYVDEGDVLPLLVICQMLFVLYGALVSLGYGYVGVKMRGNLKASSQGHHEDDQDKKLRRLVVMTFLSSLVAISVSVINVYMLFSQFGAYADVKFVQPWPYWGVHTCLRFLEVSACSLVLMLFFRSGKGGYRESFCDRCRWWRRKSFVHPSSESEKAVEPPYTTTVAGLTWKQRKEAETRDTTPQ
ncbi:proline-rich transmembrane protein 3-like [Littorina saxatilis]|uniref:Proline-rich transmembrane protein 3/4 domain-containing protein n=1 Tax=Littorina saxatilis TaxID=31220 RepID=A0AAN9BZ94_9CAEN